MNIQLGQYAGFCFGVDRAVSMVEEATKAGGTVVTHEENIAAFTDRIIRFSDGQIISDEKNLNPTPGIISCPFSRSHWTNGSKE